MIISSMQQITHRIRNRHLFFLDVILISLSVWFSFGIRLEMFVPMDYLQGVAAFVLVALLVRLAVFYALDIYRRYWLLATVEEWLLLFLSITASSVGIGVILLGILWPSQLITGFPRSILLIDWLLSLCLMGGSRFYLQALNSTRAWARQAGSPSQRTLILIAGAGEAGKIIVQELANNPKLGFKAVGFVDDDPAKQGFRVHGVPVLGRCQDLPDLVRKYNVPQVIIAMPTAPGTLVREIRERCSQAGASVRTMPSIYEILAGQVSLQHVRDVQIEDLLRREPIQTDVEAVRNYLHGNRVAITGAGGSIGSELCRQIAAIGPDLLLLIGHGENSIFGIEQELRRRFPEVSVQSIIADVRDQGRLDWVFSTWRPQVVFHAAAHKHVPLMECNVVEAVTNNIVGTRNVVRAAEAAGVERLVMISTDKAVRPASVMGASKRIAEMVVCKAARRLSRPYMTVRFGNVLGSRGSVIPVFLEQIRTGGPVTVTHPDMTRYFMTIPEAVHLVLQAGIVGASSDVLVLDMGEPVRILDLAETIVKLSGFRPHEDIDIVFTGMRLGEKLHESLFYPNEVPAYTSHGSIMIAQNGHGLAALDLDGMIDRLERLARDQNDAEILEMLEYILTSYQAADEAYTELEASWRAPIIEIKQPLHVMQEAVC